MIADPRLSVAEAHTPLWMRLRAHMQGRLDSLRAMNDSPALNDIQTATLRGQIQCLKELLDLENTPPVYDDDGNASPLTEMRVG